MFLSNRLAQDSRCVPIGDAGAARFAHSAVTALRENVPALSGVVLMTPNVTCCATSNTSPVALTALRAVNAT